MVRARVYLSVVCYSWFCTGTFLNYMRFKRSSAHECATELAVHALSTLFMHVHRDVTQFEQVEAEWTLGYLRTTLQMKIVVIFGQLHDAEVTSNVLRAAGFVWVQYNHLVGVSAESALFKLRAQFFVHPYVSFRLQLVAVLAFYGFRTAKNLMLLKVFFLENL